MRVSFTESEILRIIFNTTLLICNKNDPENDDSSRGESRNFHNKIEPCYTMSKMKFLIF